MKPTLSIVVPFFNRKQYLRRALLSILAGGVEAWEVIVVDDGSSDGSVDEIQDLPVKIVASPINRGPGHARNLGLSHTKADLIYFFDSDDELVSDSLKWLISQMAANPHWSVAGARFAEVIDHRGNKLLGPEVDRYCHGPRPPRLTFDYLAQGGSFSGGLPLFLFRRSILDEVGPFDETMKCAEDREFLFRLLRVTEVPLFDFPLVRRRVHDANLAVRLNSEGKLELKEVVRAMNRLIDMAQN